MWERIKGLLSTTSARGVMSLVAGTGGAQVVSVLSLSVMARLFAPEHFGEMALVVALTGMLSVAFNGRFDTALVVVESDEDAAGLVHLCARLIPAATPFAVALGALASFVSELSSVEALVVWGGLMPLISVAQAYNNLTRQHLNREARYGILGKISVGETVIMAAAGIALGTYAPSAASLLLAHLIRTAITPLWVWSTPSLRPGPKPTHMGLFELAKKFREYPTLNLPQALFDQLRNNTLVFALAGLHGATFTGHYSMAARILEAPLALLAVNINRVFTRDAAVIYRDRGDLGRFTHRASLALFALGAVILIPVAVFGPWLFTITFGPQWGPAGALVPLLLPWWLTRFVHTTIGHIPLITEEIRGNLWRNMGYNVLIFGAVLGGTFIEDPELFVLFFALPPAAYVVYFVFWINRIARTHTRLRAASAPEVETAEPATAALPGGELDAAGPPTKSPTGEPQVAARDLAGLAAARPSTEPRIEPSAAQPPAGEPSAGEPPAAEGA